MSRPAPRAPLPCRSLISETLPRAGLLPSPRLRASARTTFLSRAKSAAFASHMAGASATLAFRHERQPFEQHDVLFVLQKRAVQRRDRLGGIAVLEDVERH